MKYKKTNPNQLTAQKERCIRCMKRTLFTCEYIDELKGKPLCPKCETDLEAVAKKRATPPHRRYANKPTLKRTKTRNRRGSNQYKAKPRTDWMLILITLILGGLLYMMAHAMLTSRLDDTFLNRKAEAVEIISPLPETDVPASTSPEATPTPSVEPDSNEGEEAFIRRVHILESSEGRNTNPNALHNRCRAKGQENPYGYGGMALMICFDTLEQATERVKRWYREHRATRTEAQTYCYYNEGLNKDACPYWEKARGL